MKIDAKKLLIISIVLLIIWGTFCLLVINYAKDLRQHPCSICAEKIGEDVFCSTGSGGSIIFGKEGETKIG